MEATVSFSLLDSQFGGHGIAFWVGVEARDGGELDGWAASKETVHVHLAGPKVGAH